MISFPDIPGIEIHPTPHVLRETLRLELGPPMQLDSNAQLAIDRKWSELRNINPRLHDGPILLAEFSYASGSRATGSPRFAATRADLAVIARPATYKLLATATHLNTHVRALGVQGIVTAHDASGEEHLLLGRRGSEVRIYQGLWENAPSGTVMPPNSSSSFLDQTHFVSAIIDEGLEETGLNLSNSSISWIAMLDDAQAHSLDVVLKLQMQETIDPRAVPCPADDTHAWEYAATAWTPLATLHAWAEQNAHAVSPPTLALTRWLTESATPAFSP